MPSRRMCTVVQPMLTPGVRVQGRYLVDKLIATGGYATVYKVTDTRTGRPLAMKEVIDPDRSTRDQFLLEASLLANFHHANIIRGYDHFEEQGRAYLIMDYVEGQDLEQVLAMSMRRTGQPLDEAQVIRWLLPICEALDELHHQPTPIIHRDIKPANIKLTADGVPILIDFGLAKRWVMGSTNSGAQGITPGFAPPEQYLATGKTDARTDIYGMGATMYTLLTGKEPTEAPRRLLANSGRASVEGLEPIRLINPRISPATARIIEKAMDIGTEHRQQSARELRDEMLQALAELEHGRPFVAVGEMTKPLVPDGAQYPPPPPVRRGAPPVLTAPAIAMPLSSVRPVAPRTHVTPWFDLGGPPLRLAGRLWLLFSAAQVYLGLLIIAALTVVIGTNEFRDHPTNLTIGIGLVWLIVILLLTYVVIRLIERPVAGRGRISAPRRGFQGFGLFLVTVGINGGAIMFFSLFSPNMSLYSLGMLGLINIVNGLLTAANILA